MKKLFTLFLLSGLLSTLIFNHAQAESEAFSCQAGTTISLVKPSNTATGQYRLVIEDDPNFILIDGPLNLVAQFTNPDDPEHTVNIYDRDVEYIYAYNPYRVVEAVITLPRPLRAYGDTYNKDYTLQLFQGMFQRQTAVGNIDICDKSWSVIVNPNTPKNVTLSAGTKIYATDCPSHYLGQVNHNMNNLLNPITYAQESSNYSSYLSLTNNNIYLAKGVPNQGLSSVILSVDITINGVKTNTWLTIPVVSLFSSYYPSMTSQTPTYGSTGVSPFVDPVITFNYSVSRGTGMVRIQKESSLFPGFYFDDIVLDVTNASHVGISGNTVTLYPTTGLDWYENYRIVFDDCAIKKLGSSGYYRDYNDSWMFETGGYVIILPRDAEGQDVDEQFVSGLTAYPNPALDALSVRLDLEKSMEVSVRLVSMDGRTVWQKNLGQTNRVEESLDVAAYQRGMYVLQVTTEEGMHVEKITLQ